MKTKLGIEIPIRTKQKIKLIRTTLESRIDLQIEYAPKRVYEIQTGNMFLNHMLTGVASRAGFNLDVSYTSTAETFDHVRAEDTGLALGRAIRDLIEFRRADGVSERGTYTVAFDEALVRVTLAFDGRVYAFVRGDVPGLQTVLVEDIQSSSLRQFFDGFSQGAGCVVSVEFLYGDDPHHTFEAAFKALGEALRESLLPFPYRAGTTIGLKGTGSEGLL